PALELCAVLLQERLGLYVGRVPRGAFWTAPRQRVAALSQPGSRRARGALLAVPDELLRLPAAGGARVLEHVAVRARGRRVVRGDVRAPAAGPALGPGGAAGCAEA